MKKIQGGHSESLIRLCIHCIQAIISLTSFRFATHDVGCVALPDF